jgi:DNA-directed RNA polymerase specialized sigma24 family protein
MATDSENSVTEWVNELKAGDRSEAARLLWQRYFERLARLAQAWLRAVARGPADGEDVALSAFDSFFRGASAGRFSKLDNRDDLWRLLVTITERKAHNQRRNEFRKKRGAGRVIGAAAFAGAGHAGDDPLAQAAAADPTPEFAAMVADEYRRLFGSLADDSLRAVALLRLEGHSNEEIAASLDCGLRTVERKLEVIRKRWLAEGVG